MENAIWTSDLDASTPGARNAVLYIKIGDAFLPALKVTFDGQDSHLFLQRSGVWKEVSTDLTLGPDSGPLISADREGF